MQVFIYFGDQQQGPFTMDEINRSIRQGKLFADSTLAWYEGRTEWIPLREVPGILISTPPIPVEPPPLPAAKNSRPRVVRLYQIWCTTMAVTYLILASYLLVAKTSQLDKQERDSAVSAGLVLLVLASLMIVGTFSPRKPWSWNYGIAAIGISAIPFCLPLLIGIPLLIYWWTPTTKQYFHFVDGRANKLAPQSVSTNPVLKMLCAIVAIVALFLFAAFYAFVVVVLYFDDKHDHSTAAIALPANPFPLDYGTAAIALSAEPTQPDKYKVLIGEEFEGSGFVIRYGSVFLGVTSLHQFDGKAPTKLESLEGDAVMLDRTKVIKQKDVQALLVKAPTLKLQFLRYSPDFTLSEGDEVSILVPAGDVVSGTLTAHGMSTGFYKSSDGPRELKAKASEPFRAQGGSGGPVLLKQTGAVIGVLLNADDGAHARVVGFETLCLPKPKCSGPD